MSITVAKTEDVTVLTVTKNPRSNCPLICQILAALCCSPAYSVSQSLKKSIGCTQATLGTIQIMVGLLNVGIGGLIDGSYHDYKFLMVGGSPYWLGGLFIFIGAVCILTGKFPSPCLVFINGLLNIGSACLAIFAIVIYAVDIGDGFYNSCDYDDYYYDRRGRPIPTSAAANKAICRIYFAKSKVMWIGMDAIMIIFAVLQLCVALSACVLAFKAACKGSTTDKDPELEKPLVDEVISGPKI